MESVGSSILVELGSLLVLGVIVEDVPHLLDGIAVVVFLKDVLSSLGYHVLEHGLLFLQEELEPETFPLGNHLDIHAAVDVLILVLDVGVEVRSPLAVLDLPSDCVEELEELDEEHDDDADDDQVEERELDDQQAQVEYHHQEEEHDDPETRAANAANASLLRLVLDVAF